MTSSLVVLRSSGKFWRQWRALADALRFTLAATFRLLEGHFEPLASTPYYLTEGDKYAAFTSNMDCFGDLLFAFENV